MVYMGSKSRFAKDIVSILQKTIDDNNVNTYIECFVGGANIIDKISKEFGINHTIYSYSEGFNNVESSNNDNIR